MRWLMGWKKRRAQTFSQQEEEILCAAAKSRHLEIAGESMELLQSTLNPRTFFGRCDDIAFSEERITGKASQFLQDTELLTKLQLDFIDRMSDAGRIAALKEGMQPYIGRLTDAALAHYRRVVSRL